MNVAIIFPGQGAQKVGMGRELFDNFPSARRVYEEASDALGLDVARLCFDGPESALTLTENTQPAVLATSVAACRVFQEESGVEPTLTAGHSLGEYSALALAGALTLAEASRAVKQRGAFMQQAVPEGEGAMAAVIGLDPEEVEKICSEASDGSDEIAVPANYNSPLQTVISGHKGAVAKASELASQNGAKRVVSLKVSAPFHSPLMAPAAVQLRETLDKMTFHDASCPLIANVDAMLHADSMDFPPLLAKQVVEPVRWVDSMLKLKENDVEMAVEVGPGKVLCGLMRQIDQDVKTANVEDVTSLKKTLAAL